MSAENQKLCRDIMQAANLLRSHVPVLLSRYFKAVEDDETASPGFEREWYGDTRGTVATLFDELLGLTERFKLVDRGDKLNFAYVEREPEDKPIPPCKKCGQTLIFCCEPGMPGSGWLICETCGTATTTAEAVGE